MTGEEVKWAVVEVGYKRYVLPLPDAVKLLGLLSAACIWEDKYHSESKTTTKHIYPQEDTAFYFRAITDDTYRIAKLAGKPE